MNFTMTKKSYISKFLKFFKKIEIKKNNSLFLNGVFDTLPLVFAAVPFGVIFGALSVSIGLSPLMTISMSSRNLVQRRRRDRRRDRQRTSSSQQVVEKNGWIAYKNF